MRLCFVKVGADEYRAAAFHKWCERASFDGGQFMDTYALIEYLDDGTIGFVVPTQMIFIDDRDLSGEEDKEEETGEENKEKVEEVRDDSPEIKVGDIVKRLDYENDNLLVTRMANSHVCGVNSNGCFEIVKTDLVIKTGRHIHGLADVINHIVSAERREENDD